MQPEEFATFKRFVKMLWFALFASVCLYWPMLRFLQIKREEGPAPTVLHALTFIALGTAGAVLFLRFNRIPAVWSRQPLDSAALNQLRTFYILCFVLAEAVALFGMVFFSAARATRLSGSSAVPSYSSFFATLAPRTRPSPDDSQVLEGRGFNPAEKQLFYSRALAPEALSG